MNAQLHPLPGQLLLVIAPQAGGALMLDLIARLACRGPLRLLDGGNRFDVYRCNLAIARALGGQTAEVPAILDNVRLARAFTCYQMAALLRQTPPAPRPVLVLDMLSTFYDESVPAAESRRLLGECIRDLQRLNRLAPVAISACPKAAAALPDLRPELLDDLRAAATRVWILEPHLPASPPQLF